MLVTLLQRGETGKQAQRALCQCVHLIPCELRQESRSHHSTRFSSLGGSSVGSGSSLSLTMVLLCSTPEYGTCDTIGNPGHRQCELTPQTAHPVPVIKTRDLETGSSRSCFSVLTCHRKGECALRWKECLTLFTRDQN